MKDEKERRIEPTQLHAAGGQNEWGPWLVAFVPPLAITLAGITVFREVIYRSIAASAHPVLVYVILGAFYLGLLLCGVALVRYQREARYVRAWQRRILKGRSPEPAPGERRGRMPIVAAALAALLSRGTVSQRQARFELEVAAASSALSDRLAYANYIAGALIGLGLVGTFVGLLGTLEDLGAVFGSLAGTGNSEMNPTAVFANMVQKLQDPMKGMGTAFVSSLYGLLGSLVVGLCALSVSKAGSAVIKDLHAASRALEAFSIDAASSESSEQAVSTFHLQALMNRFLETQIELDARMQSWLETSEKRMGALFNQVLEVNRNVSNEMVSKHQKVSEQLASLLGAYGDNTQAISSRLMEQDQHLTGTIRDLVERVNADQTLLRQDVLGSLERIHSDRTTQVEGISRTVEQLASLTERSAQALQQHIESQEERARQLPRSVPRPRRRWWPFGDNDRWADEGLADERHESGLTLLARSIDRQTRIFEDVILRNSHSASDKHPRD